MDGVAKMGSDICWGALKYLLIVPQLGERGDDTGSSRREIRLCVGVICAIEPSLFATTPSTRLSWANRAGWKRENFDTPARLQGDRSTQPALGFPIGIFIPIKNRIMVA